MSHPFYGFSEYFMRKWKPGVGRGKTNQGNISRLDRSHFLGYPICSKNVNFNPFFFQVIPNLFLHIIRIWGIDKTETAVLTVRRGLEKVERFIGLVLFKG